MYIFNGIAFAISLYSIPKNLCIFFRNPQIMIRLFSSFSKFVLPFFCLIIFSQRLVYAQTATDVHVNYSYPTTNATRVSAKTTIGVRFSEAIRKTTFQSSAFNVIGSSSAYHNGKLILALDGRTLIFTPNTYFSTGEKVTVTISPFTCVSGKRTVPYSFTFQISKSKTLPTSLSMHPIESSDAVISGSATNVIEPRKAARTSGADTLPDDFPKIYIAESNNPAPGKFYLGNFKFTRNDSGTYLIILDNFGNVLFERSTWPAFAQDFRPQPNGLLTFFDADPNKSKFYALDSNFVLRDSFEAKNGYNTDSHELIFLPGGGYALLAQASEQVNMSGIVSNGDTNTTVVENILQEFDADKNLLFEWKTRDHFALSDPTHENFAQPFLDFTHCNSIDYDRDSTFLLSSRNLDEVTKINPENGNIIWRWGGKHNEFSFVNDSLIFSHQHAVRRLPNGNITMFDNGTFHNTAQPFSRAVEYRLDEKMKVATKVWEYHHNPDVYSRAMGYVQRLENGNSVIGWGGCDSVAVTEVKPDGSTALEIKFDPGIYSYRAYKFTKDQSKSAVLLQNSAQDISLGQNYPNPFTTSTTITFHTSARVPIKLRVYDALGKEIKMLFNGTVEAGSYSSKFRAENLPDGIYICKLTTPATTISKAMIISK